MGRFLPFILAAAVMLAQPTPDQLEGRKRMQELVAKTYVKCAANDYRLVAETPNQFKIAEYETLSHLLDIQESEPQNTKGVQYRAVAEHSCSRKRIYTLARVGTEWKGQWSAWTACGKTDPDNPLVLNPTKAGEPTTILKRAGAWSLTGAKYNTEPKPISCQDVPDSSADWLRGFLSRHVPQTR